MESLFKKIIVALLAAGFPEPEAINRLAGDASNREYYRVFLPSTDYPSIVVMVLNEDRLAVSEEIEDSQDIEIDEHPFVNVRKLLSEIGINVPEILFFHEKMGVMGLQDVGDCILENYVKNGNPFRKYYEDAVDILVKLHTGKVDGKKYIPFRKKFGFNLFFWEFEHYLEYGLEENGFEITPEERESLLMMFHELSARYVTYPYALTHRDFHSRNLMIFDEKIYVIDFQDALMGPWHYDLASFLRDAYVEIEDDFMDELIERYLHGMKRELGVEIDRDKFRQDFELMAFQRNLKAIGRFYYLKMVKGKPHLVKYVPTLYKYVFKYIDKYPQLEPLGNVLDRNKNLLKKLLMNPS